MLNLNQVTLLCIESRSPDLALFALNQCTKNVNFKKVVLMTDLNKHIDAHEGIELVSAPKIKTTRDYSLFLLSDITPLIEGTHVLIIQWDSFITNPGLWDQIFLDYDYIGAPWPHHPKTPVGNGGFSLRSVKLIKALQNEQIIKAHPEDQSICINNRKFLEDECGIKFAPTEIAEKFAIERGPWRDSFGFHGMFNFAKLLDSEPLDFYIKKTPKEFLGGLDTYELIEDLIARQKIEEARLVLSRSRPKKERKYRFHRMHLKLWFRLFLAKLRSPQP
jgi:hypothetical protein